MTALDPLTDTELSGCYDTVRENCVDPLVKAMVDILRRQHLAEREMRKLAAHQAEMIDGILGHRVYADNDRHSRKADIKAVQ